DRGVEVPKTEALFPLDFTFLLLRYGYCFHEKLKKGCNSSDIEPKVLGRFLTTPIISHFLYF
ncbi:MAG: hypothetical protein ABJA70_23795, partial [Chryseolinea sp.]